uniref:Ovule protein n=1 Tax=Heterorhabditis bacteriophora TaxID=37862 RepID=A0A1I7XGX5_HETBA
MRGFAQAHQGRQVLGCNYLHMSAVPTRTLLPNVVDHDILGCNEIISAFRLMFWKTYDESKVNFSISINQMCVFADYVMS